MSEFHDPELRQQLSRLSGEYPDDNAAFAAWQRRVGQVRRRRVVAWTSGAAMSLIVITIGVAALQNPGRHTIVPGKSSDTTARVTVSIATTEADDSTTAPKAPETTTALVHDTTPITEAEAEAETAVAEPEATAAAGSGSNAGKSGGSTTPTHEPEAATETKTFTSDGGSITVRRDGDRLTVIAIDPAEGFHDESDEDDQSGHRVKVTFKSGRHTSQISVKVEDGKMEDDISEHSDSREESGPHDTSGGDHDGYGHGND